QAVQHWISKSHTRLLLFLQVLIDERRTSCPKRCCCTGTTYGYPPTRWTSRCGNGAVCRITSRGISICRDIRHLAVAIAVLVLHTGTSLPARLLEETADATTTTSPFGAALCVAWIAPYRFTAI